MTRIIKIWTKLIVLLVLVPFLSSFKNGQLVLCKDGKAKARIVVAENPTEVERHASAVMQHYLKRITGADYEIVSDMSPIRSNEILIGKVNRPEIKTVPFEKLKTDGYVISVSNRRLVVAGGTEKGTLYGVYGFLEKYLGCKKYSSKVTVVPTRRDIVLKTPVRDLEIPQFEFREILYKDVYDPEYMEWHALDQHQSDSYRKGEWGSWCHTTYSLVPPDRFFKDHPEYFSMLDGKRVANPAENKGDICWSSEGAFNTAYQNLKYQIEQNPEVLYWSVSQQDNADYCRCPKCMEIYEKTGSQQGTIIPFINRMARKFPDKIISTLSYWYSTTPPKGVEVEKNVNILLCDIGSPRHIPIEQGDPKFASDLKAWHKIHDNFLIWDYVIQFTHLMAPFPNLRVLQPNLQFLHKNGVKAMFEQGNRDSGGEFSELRAYILSKLLWNPYQNVDAIINDFVNGFYGPAGKYIKEYIDMMHNSLESTKAKLSIFGRPWDQRDTFLSEDMIAKYYILFDKALNAVRDQPEYIPRVMLVKAQIDYAVLDIAKQELTGKRGALEKRDGVWTMKKEIKDLLGQTMNLYNLNSVTRIHEWNTIPFEYSNEYYRYIEEKRAALK